ncbi:hypothetical protein F2Q70_00020109 [Brassica cretica]|uniref:Uncharacterized protein n=1 Tax=Brassica cretica TaxID=69181 RepID=A0A8S9GQK8_BRACR|nr:hypothetical protein F2Q70_00020109 [Brassica cretica]
MFVSQKIYKLEMEQKRVQEDALVYNWLQQQLKLSPAYKKVLEISASMELKEKSSTELDSQGDEVSDISFEELLEQEKKDSFWSVTLSLSRKLISIKMEDCEPAAGHELLIEYVLVLP